MKQRLPAERLHGKPYTNLSQPHVDLPNGQMALLFLTKGGEVGWGGGGNQLSRVVVVVSK